MEFVDCLQVLADQLGDKPYFGGDNLGYMDVALVPFYSWLEVYETFGNFKIESSFKLITWAKRCLQRESVSKSLPEQLKVFDFISTLRKRLDIAQKDAWDE